SHRGETVILIHSMTHSSKPWVCNTPRNERLSTTNLPHRKNGNVCWPRRTLRESACKLGQAESLTSGETCNAITVKQAELQLKRLFQRQFNEKARQFSSSQLGNDYRVSALRDLLGDQKNHEGIRLHLSATFARSRRIKIRGGQKD